MLVATTDTVGLLLALWWAMIGLALLFGAAMSLLTYVGSEDPRVKARLERLHIRGFIYWLKANELLPRSRHRSS